MFRAVAKFDPSTLKSKVRSILGAPSPAAFDSTSRRLRSDLDATRMEIGRLHASRMRDVAALNDAEFRVFSQFGEDGIIQWLVQRVPIDEQTFVEFGVGDYSESNTRLLVEMANWRGLIIDGDDAHLQFLVESGIAWRHTVDARSAFLTAENLDATISSAGYEGDVGLVSIDVDGVDYWMLDALNAVRPRILVVEYNSHYGPHRAVTIPYDPAFERMEAHWSGLYYGVSIAGLARCADRKGYALVGSNSTATNAFFVRRDVLGAIPEVAPEQAWRPNRVRQARGPDGELTYLSGVREQLSVFADKPLIDLDDGRETTVGELFLK